MKRLKVNLFIEALLPALNLRDYTVVVSVNTNIVNDSIRFTIPETENVFYVEVGPGKRWKDPERIKRVIIKTLLTYTTRIGRLPIDLDDDSTEVLTTALYTLVNSDLTILRRGV